MWLNAGSLMVMGKGIPSLKKYRLLAPKIFMQTVHIREPELLHVRWCKERSMVILRSWKSIRRSHGTSNLSQVRIASMCYLSI